MYKLMSLSDRRKKKGNQAGLTNLVELTNQDIALEYANMGYLVIASWKNPATGDAHSPHFATVRPGMAKHNTDGIYVANVGETNGIRTLVASFRRDRIPAVKFYYNPSQKFIETADAFASKMQGILKYLGYK